MVIREWFYQNRCCFKSWSFLGRKARSATLVQIRLHVAARYVPPGQKKKLHNTPGATVTYVLNRQVGSCKRIKTCTNCGLLNLIFTQIQSLQYTCNNKKVSSNKLLRKFTTDIVAWRSSDIPLNALTHIIKWSMLTPRADPFIT